MNNPNKSKTTPEFLKGSTVDKKGLDSVVANIPLGRLTDDADMAGAALYFASRAGAYVTGAVLPVDGGYGSLK